MEPLDDLNCGCVLEPGHDGPCLDDLSPDEAEDARAVRLRTRRHYNLSPKEDHNENPTG